MQTSESEYQDEPLYNTMFKIGIIGSLLSMVEIFMTTIGYSLLLFQDFNFLYLSYITIYTSMVLLITGVAGILLRYRSKYALPVVFLYLIYRAITQHLSLGEYSFYLFVAINLIIGIMLVTIRSDVQNSWLLYGVSAMFTLKSVIPLVFRLTTPMPYPFGGDFIAAMIWWSPTLIAHAIYCIFIILLLYSEIRPGFLSRKIVAIET